MLKRAGSAFATSFMLAFPIQAQAPAEAFPITGFGTLGLTRSNTNDVAFIRDLGQPNGVTRSVDGRLDTRLGLQLSHPLAESLQGTLQVLSKYQYDGTFRPVINWAFLDWSPLPELQVRLGRTVADMFMNSDSQDVGYSYLWARPPVEYLGSTPSPYVDGLDAAETFAFGTEALFRLKGYLGRSAGTLPAYGNTLNLAGSILGLVTELQDGPWRGRLAYGQFRPSHDFSAPVTDLQAALDQFGSALHDPGLFQSADSLAFSRLVFNWYSAAISFEEGALQAQAGVNRLCAGNLPVSPNSWSGLVSLGYRMGSVVPYGTWSRLVSDRPSLYLGALPTLPNPEAQQLVQGTNALAAGVQYDRYTLATGLRWDFATKADFKFQVDWLHAHNSVGLLADPQPGWTGRATLITAVIDFIF